MVTGRPVFVGKSVTAAGIVLSDDDFVALR